MLWLIAVPTVLLLISTITFFTIRSPRADSEIEDSVSVIVPLRNEAENVSGLVQSLLS